MMLRREHYVLESRELRKFGPFFRLEAVGIEVLRKNAVEPLDVIRRRPNQRMRDHTAKRAIYRPMDEQAQTAIAENLHARRIIRPRLCRRQARNEQQPPD